MLNVGKNRKDREKICLATRVSASVRGSFPGKKYWSGLPCPSAGDLPNPGIAPVSLTSPALAGRLFTTCATCKGVYCKKAHCNSGVLRLVSLVAQTVKRLPAMRETRVQSISQKDPLEQEMATLSSILAWKIPWTEEPGRLQSMGSQRVGHD